MARVFGYTFSVRLSSEDRARLQQLLKRFGKTPWATNSVNFRELLKRLDFPYETQMDNEGWSFDEERPEESPEQPGY